MKKIVIKGKEFGYKVHNHTDGFYDSSLTVFFTETVTRKTRKYYEVFGPVAEYEEPIELFKVDFNIEDPTMSRNEIKLILERKVELFERESEIVMFAKKVKELMTPENIEKFKNERKGVIIVREDS